MGRGHPIDRDKLHEFFWKKSNRFGVLSINQKELAEKMNLAHETINRIIKKMVAEKRLTKMSSAKHNIHSYLVKDPAAWRIMRNSTKDI
jgi:DNA-binding MarR family transcriptional regulator